jgi:hypothetical protein
MVEHRTADPGTITCGRRFELGDRVRATEDVGGFWWPKVRRGSPGIVVGWGPRSTVLVHFNRTHTLAVEPGSIIGADPRSR